MRRNGNRHGRGARGVALVELAVVTPLMVLLFAGMSELGWALHQQDVLTRATRDGVRFAAGRAANPSVGVVAVDVTLATQTRNLVVFGNTGGTGEPLLPGLAPAMVTVTVPDATHVRVEADYPYQPLFSALPFMSGALTGFQLRSSVVMTAL